MPSPCAIEKCPILGDLFWRACPAKEYNRTMLPIAVLSFGVLSGVSLLPQTEWRIAFPYKEGTTSRMGINLTVEIGMEETTQVEFIGELTVKSVTESGYVVGVSWKDIRVEGQEMDPYSFEMNLNKRGFPVSTTSEFGDEMRRMTLPLLIAYPEKPIKTGERWSFTHEVKKYSAEYFLEATEEVGGSTLLKVRVQFSEGEEGGMKGEGTFWLDTTGKIEKFQVTVSQWPLAPVYMVARKVSISGRALPSGR
jgi:hypothetical protein